MLIGIDGNEANVEKRVGISEYAFELLMQFYENQKSKFPAKQDLASRDKFQIYLKDRQGGDFPREREGWRYRIVGPRKLWTQFALPLNLYLSKSRPDVFFTPSHYAPRFSPIPTVISIMDLSYIHFPEMFKKSDLYQLRNWTAYSVKNAKKILTISQASKDDIIKEYQLPEDKVVVTYPGIKKESGIMNQESGINRIKKRYGISKNYILFVGTLQPRKNIIRLIEAFSRICHPELVLGSQSKRDSDFGENDIQLVVVGKKGWMYEEILEAPKKFGIEDRVKFLDYVSDEDLRFFYKHAVCFILPSLYEGFGLPVLEAMKYGCPVITSNVSSLPEAGGDAALYVDPLNVDDIVKNLELIISPSADGSKLRQKLIKKGYEQVKKFSWEKTARETLRAIESIT